MLSGDRRSLMIGVFYVFRKRESNEQKRLWTSSGLRIGREKNKVRKILISLFTGA